MARLVGVGLLLWAVYASVTYAIEQAPRPASASPAAGDRPSPVDALIEATAEPEPAIRPAPPGPAFPPGAYSIGPSADERIRAADRDHRPRDRVFSDATSDGDARSGVDGASAGDAPSDADGVAGDRDGLDDGEGVEGRAEDEAPATPRAVVGEIAPGLYTTGFDVEGCTYELWRVMGDGRTRVIAEEYLASGRLLVSINGIEPDWFTATEGCGPWYPWRPVPDPLTAAGNGDYWVGDLAPGVWLVPAPCRWDEVVAFRGAGLHDVVDSGSGPGSLTVDGETLGVRLRGCRTPIRLTSGDA